MTDRDKTMMFTVNAAVGETVIASGSALSLDEALALFKRGIEEWAEAHGSLVAAAAAAADVATKPVVLD